MKEFLLDLFSCFKYCRKELGGTWYLIYEEYDDMVGTRSAASYWTREETEQIDSLWLTRKIVGSETY